MRTSLLVTLGILLASTTPTALASPSALRFDMPDGRLGPDVVVPVNVTLMITDFMCHEPREFFVNLSAISSEGVKATFAKTNLTYTTPAHTYFAEPYRQTQTVNLTVRALVAGQIEITAVFLEHEAGPCLAPDGFQSSSVTVAANVDGPAAPPATQPPASEPAANETTPTPASPTPPARPTAPTGMSCAPDGGCGFISDYEAPAESAEDNGVPALGLVGAVAALSLTAIVLRRRKA